MLFAALLVLGCRPLESTPGSETETSSETASGTSDGFPEPDECVSSEECEGGYCVAPWDGQPPRGPAECVDSCVGELDFARYCIDDASCCEGLVCSNDGLCEEPWESGDGDGDGTTGDGDGEPTGDGDGDASGDGDGDLAGDGDGDLAGDGDGDGTTGDGDGDGTTGDGDGDTTTGDGDGDGP